LIALVLNYARQDWIAHFNKHLEIKKKGLHEGSGLPAILSEKLGVEKTNYRVKNRFLYNSLKMLFENGIEPNLCDVDYIIDQTKKQDKYDS